MQILRQSFCSTANPQYMSAFHWWVSVYVKGQNFVNFVITKFCTDLNISILKQSKQTIWGLGEGILVNTIATEWLTTAIEWFHNQIKVAFFQGLPVKVVKKSFFFCDTLAHFSARTVSQWLGQASSVPQWPGQIATAVAQKCRHGSGTHHRRGGNASAVRQGRQSQLGPRRAAGAEICGRALRRAF